MTRSITNPLSLITRVPSSSTTSFAENAFRKSERKRSFLNAYMKLSGQIAVRIMLALAAIFILQVSANAQVFTVTNTNDGGPGSLRDGLMTASVIHFNIPSTDPNCNPTTEVCTIRPLSNLPTVSFGTKIDGYTQPGASVNTLAQGTNAVLKIEIKGPNTGVGLRLFNAATITGLIINNFPGGGVTLEGTGNTVLGCFIGTDSTGTIAVPNGSNGDHSAVSVHGDCHLIGRAPHSGATNCTQIFDGTLPPAMPADRNLISGNATHGIKFPSEFGSGSSSNYNRIQNNLIGTQADGVSPLGNSLDGIFFRNNTSGPINDNLIMNNVIAFNGANGVNIAHAGVGTANPPIRNRILDNSIHANGQLGISLGYYLGEVDNNDACDGDTGQFAPNELQNYPVITSASISNGNYLLNGFLNSTAGGTFTIQFYASDFCDFLTTKGEGKTYLGEITVSDTDSDCFSTFSASFPVPMGAGHVVTATATDSVGNTSEFSGCMPASDACSPSPADQVSLYRAENNANDSNGVNQGTLQNGGTYAPGIVGQAFSLDGVDDKITVPDSPSLNVGPGSYTFETWAKFNAISSPNFHQVIAQKKTQFSPGFQLDMFQGVLRLTVSASVQGAGINSNTNVFAGDWFHVAFVVDRTTNTVRLYVNGALQTTQPSIAGSFDDTSPLYIGGDDQNHGLNGLIDETAIYNRALSEAEIQSIYYAGGSGKCPAPTITPTGGPLDFNNVAYGATSAPQSYTVSGSNLLGNIDINAPAGYEVSLTSVGGYGPSLSLTPTAGSVPTTTIFVHFVPSGTGVAGGNVTYASNGATTQNVGVTGTGVLGKFQSVSNGNWNNPATWEVSGDGGTNYSPTSISPTSSTADTITVHVTHGVNVTANVNADQLTVDFGGTLNINNTVALTIDDGSGTDMTVAGNCLVNDTGLVNGAGSFQLSANGTLGIGSANGITSGTTASGSIQNTGGRTYDGGATYTYIGSVNQAVGNGLPSSVLNLHINNIGSAGNNIVTGSAGGQTVTNVLAINSGVFASNAGTYHHVTAQFATGLVLLADINCNGNWATEATITHNSHKVTFNGSTPQVIGTSLLTFFDVTINNAAGVQLLNDMTINGTLTLQNGQFDTSVAPRPASGPQSGPVLFMANPSAINRVVGTVTSAPIFLGEVDLTYSGSTATTSGPELPLNTTSLRNLSINNSAGVTMSANATAHGLLSLTAADLNTGSFTLTMPQQGTTAGSFDVVGNAKRTGFDQVPFGTLMSFGNPFNRISIDGGTQPTEINVNLVKSAPGTFPAAVQRTYTITPSATGSIATLQLHYLDSELGVNLNEEILSLYRFNGTIWQPQGAITHSSTQNWVRQTGINSFSPWAISSGTPSAAMATVSGRTATADGTAIEGATIHLSGGQTRMAITDADGNYRFDNVEVGQFYTVTPSRANFAFNPTQRSFSLVSNQTDESFTGTAKSDNENPLDTPEYFVRQQYVDVLGREPDEGGFIYWSGQLNQCSDLTCMQARRVSVAAQFFISREFQDTGSYIYGVYEGSLGRRPQFAEYAGDRRQILGGPNMDEQKTLFAQNFVQRGEFVTRYQTATTAEQFVDSLLQNVQMSSGVDLSGQRPKLIDVYNSGQSLVASRGAVLRAVADDPAFVHAGYNAAFVLTEYFAYLRRDPDQGGFDFWLGVLNNGGAGNYRAMVCSFVTSTEYQRRFSNIVTHSNGECAGVTVARNRAFQFFSLADFNASDHSSANSKNASLIIGTNRCM